MKMVNRSSSGAAPPVAGRTRGHVDHNRRLCRNSQADALLGEFQPAAYLPTGALELPRELPTVRLNAAGNPNG